MTCEVLLFAGVAEAVGAARLELELPAGATVGDALDILSERHPAIAAIRPSLAVAVDERYAPPTAVVEAGSTLALIPPVSGG